MSEDISSNGLEPLEQDASLSSRLIFSASAVIPRRGPSVEDVSVAKVPRGQYPSSQGAGPLVCTLDY